MIPFRDVLRLGSTGTQPVAVKRGLWRAGYRTGWGELDGPAVSARVLGPMAVRQLKKFQAAEGLEPDGVYGSSTHTRLQRHFDKYAESLYLAPPLQLPTTFSPTHQTAGLPGFPAIDVFGWPGTEVLAPEAGTITRLSGKSPALGGQPGSAYGWSLYLTVPHATYFLTHFGSTEFGTDVGPRNTPVKRGERLGTICDAKVAGMPSSSSHIHEGKRVE